MTQTNAAKEVDLNAWRLHRKEQLARQNEVHKQLTERRHQQSVRIN